MPKLIKFKTKSGKLVMFTSKKKAKSHKDMSTIGKKLALKDKQLRKKYPKDLVKRSKEFDKYASRLENRY